MAKLSSKTPAASAAPAKTGKAAEKSAPAKPKATASGEEAEARNSFKGKSITVLDPDKTYRAGRGLRWDIVRKAKKTDAVLGVSFDPANPDSVIGGNHLAFFVKDGAISIE